MTVFVAYCEDHDRGRDFTCRAASSRILAMHRFRKAEKPNARTDRCRSCDLCNADQTYFALTLLERRLVLIAGQVMASYGPTSRAVAGTQTMGAKPVGLLPDGVADALEIHGPIFVAEVPPI